MRIFPGATEKHRLVLLTKSCVLASCIVAKSPPQEASVRTAMSAGDSSPPCAALKMSGKLPGMYSTYWFVPNEGTPGVWAHSPSAAVCFEWPFSGG